MENIAMWVGVGVLFILYVVMVSYSNRKEMKKDQRCTVEVYAKCVDRYIRDEIDGFAEDIPLSSLTYFTVWEFKYKNWTYRAKIQVEKCGYSEKGELSKIRINPKNPTEAVKEFSVEDNKREERYKVENKVSFIIRNLITTIAVLIIVIYYLSRRG